MSMSRSPRYCAMLSLNPRAGHSVRSGANLVSRRGAGALLTRPDQFACRNLASTSRLTRFILGSTSIEAGGPKVPFTQAEVGTEAACLAFVNGAAARKCGEEFIPIDGRYGLSSRAFSFLGCPDSCRFIAFVPSFSWALAAYVVMKFAAPK